MAIKDFKTKQEEKLFYALQKLIGNCVDSIGIPKKPTVKQLMSANKVLTDFEKQTTLNQDEKVTAMLLAMEFGYKQCEKGNRLWVYQSNLSGDSNGHFEFLELPVKSTAEDVLREAAKQYCKCFNIHNLGIFASPIKGNFCAKNVGQAIPKKYYKK